MLRSLLPRTVTVRAALCPISLLSHPLPRSYTAPSGLFAMPPKAAASKRGKRKVESTSPQPESGAKEPIAGAAAEENEEGVDEQEDKPKKPKRAKQAKEPVKPIDPSVPTNLTVPDDLEPFPRPADGCIRISAWNVAGLRASEKKGAGPLFFRVITEYSHSTDIVQSAKLRTGFSRYVDAEDADILVVTETKTPEMDLPSLNDRYEVCQAFLAFPGVPSKPAAGVGSGPDSEVTRHAVPLLGRPFKEGTGGDSHLLQDQAAERYARVPSERRSLRRRLGGAHGHARVRKHVPRGNLCVFALS